jgi:hypothetical protein
MSSVRPVASTPCGGSGSTRGAGYQQSRLHGAQHGEDGQLGQSVRARGDAGGAFAQHDGPLPDHLAGGHRAARERGADEQQHQHLTRLPRGVRSRGTEASAAGDDRREQAEQRR